MAHARYTIYVPQTGINGEVLPDVAKAAHSYLGMGHAPVAGATLDRNKHCTFGAHSGPHDYITAFGEDTPETDGHIKQLGTFIGELTGHPVTNAIKEGKGGIAHWTVRTLTQPSTQPQA